MGNKQSTKLYNPQIVKKTNAQLEAEEGQSLVIDERTAKQMGEPAIILDHLILASSFDVANKKFMDEMKVGWILNVAEECGNLYSHPDINYHKIALADMAAEYQHDEFEAAFKVIETARKSYEQSQNDPNFAGRTRCIVHCMRGRSRSATIVIAYLMKFNSWSLKEAYTHVKKLRVAIGPHHHLKMQLIDYENKNYTAKSFTNLEEWLLLQAAMEVEIKQNT